MKESVRPPAVGSQWVKGVHDGPRTWVMVRGNRDVERLVVLIVPASGQTYEYAIGGASAEQSFLDVLGCSQVHPRKPPYGVQSKMGLSRWRTPWGLYR